MNPQLPEIVERVKPTRGVDGTFQTLMLGPDRNSEPCFSWRCHDPVAGEYRNHIVPSDAENACVAALLGRLKPAYGMTRDLTGWAVWDMAHKDPERVFGTSPLLALFTAFEKYPHWFSALSADERAGKEGEE